MTKHAPRRPHRTRIDGEDQVMAELRRRTAERGAIKAVAYEAGLAQSAVSNVIGAARPMPPALAESLGYRLAWVKIDEQLVLPMGDPPTPT